jgi:hypothetical protein
MQETEETFLFGQNLPMLTGEVFGMAEGIVTSGQGAGGAVTVWLVGSNVDGPKVIGVPTPNSVMTYPHSHQFKNLPLSLTVGSSDTRERAGYNDKPVAVPPVPVQHGPKGGGLFAVGERLIS